MQDADVDLVLSQIAAVSAPGPATRIPADR